MATVTQAKISPVTLSGDQATVTVDYDLEFGVEEIGKTFKVVVELWSKDGPGDEQPATFPLYRRPLHTFTFGSSFFFKRPYRTVVPQSTVVSQTATNTLSRETLDEDPGSNTFKTPGGTVSFPHADEVYARVTVARESSANSETVMFVA